MEVYKLVEICILLIITLCIIGIIYLKYNRNRNFDFGKEGVKLPNYADIPLFRDIPCDGDLYRAYWVAYEYNIIDFNESRNGLIGAILLKLLKENRIKIIPNEENNHNYGIDISMLEYTDNVAENELIDMLKKSAGENLIIENDEFKDWCNTNYLIVDRFYTKVIRYETRNLIKDGYIKQVRKGRKIKNVVDSKLKQEAINLYGLKKFLASYSLIDEREIKEVHIWDEYLIYAQLFGMADKVSDQLSKIYPNMRFDSKYNSNTFMTFICDIILSIIEYFESNKTEVIE